MMKIPGGKYINFSCGSMVRFKSCRRTSADMSIAMLHAANICTKVKNHTIEKPYTIACQCSDFVTKQNYHLLKMSRSHLHA